MKTTGNTILITGGNAGIGFAIAKLMIEQGNSVIIVGRDETRLAQAKSRLPSVTTFQADINDDAAVKALHAEMIARFPNLNVLINNAGKAFAYQLTDKDHDAFGHAAEEMLTNYLSIIRLNELFLPSLGNRPEAAIVNVSSVVAVVPSVAIPTYSASKAALHAYTSTLRLNLSASKIKVFELFPPLVNTEFSKEIGGEKGIDPAEVAQALLAGLQKDEFEIRVGDAAKMYELSLSSPALALQLMNGATVTN